MISKIPFYIRDSICIDFCISEFSREQKMSGSNIGLGIVAHNTDHIDHYAHNTLIDIDDWLIGTIDPHKLGDISNV